MGCNCKWLEIIIALVILIVVIWPGIIGETVSWWVTIIAAVLLLIHALTCKNCGVCKIDAVSDMPAKKSKKKRK